MKYDPYVKRYISLEDYIKDGGLPNESMLEEEYNKLPDHPDMKQVSSHVYQLPAYEVTEEGLKEVPGIHCIKFCKGSKDAPGHSGFITDSLIEVCKMYLESVNQGDLKNMHTTAAIMDLESALWNLAERQKDRVKRGVAQTYQK